MSSPAEARTLADIECVLRRDRGRTLRLAALAIPLRLRRQHAGARAHPHDRRDSPALPRPRAQGETPEQINTP
jgi:hypothetical protein